MWSEFTCYLIIAMPLAFAKVRPKSRRQRGDFVRASAGLIRCTARARANHVVPTTLLITGCHFVPTPLLITVAIITTIDTLAPVREGAIATIALLTVPTVLPTVSTPSAAVVVCSV
jgi:hypothetical protein